MNWTFKESTHFFGRLILKEYTAINIVQLTSLRHADKEVLEG